MLRRLLLPLLLVSPVVLVGCGGGGGGGGGGGASIAASSTYAQQCAADNPYLADASTTTTTGSLTTEKQWIRSYFNEAYLWYDAVPTVDASSASYSGAMTSLDGNDVPLPLSNYFSALKTTATTSSGTKVDQFSFTYPTKAWDAYINSGATAGYGIEWMYYASRPPRSWRVAMVQPGSPAATAGIQRGDTLLTVDGVDFVNDNTTTGIATLNAGLFPNAGEPHTFTFSRTGSSNVSVSLTSSSSVAVDPVPTVKTYTAVSSNKKFGYMVFTHHIASSEQMLIDAVTWLNNQGITDLVLDLRYNGGGYLYVASELAYMIAGPTNVGSKYFEKLQYNAKRTADNAKASTPFYNTSCILDSNYNCTNQQPLPTLNLSRVFVLTQGDTCSASESIINGLSGIGVQVIQIGGTTCGKPYGFTAKDNCGVSYFPIEFKGINNAGFGDYPDGFSPVASNAGGAKLLGCSVTDDLDHELGNTSENMFYTAAYYLINGSCPAGTVPASGIQATALKATGPVGKLLQSEIRRNRILLPSGSPR